MIIPSDLVGRRPCMRPADWLPRRCGRQDDIRHVHAEGAARLLAGALREVQDHWRSFSRAKGAMAPLALQFLHWITTRKQEITDGQKPSGNGGKPSGVLFLTAHRQEHADRSPMSGKVHFSWRLADRNASLMAIPDDRPFPGKLTDSWRYNRQETN